MENTGRPAYREDTYKEWLKDMKPFLKMGCSLFYAIEKANLTRHKNRIYQKYRLKDWFWEKINAFQSYPGELANEVYVRAVEQVFVKVSQEERLTPLEVKMLKDFTSRHRSCNPFFVQSRIQVKSKNVDEISAILDSLERE